jgi:hypothetical protein
MLRGKILTQLSWPLTYEAMTLKINRVSAILRTKYVPSLVKIHWRMLILECSQRCYAVKIWPCDLDLWPWKSIGFQILLRTKYVPSLVKIHWRMLILECSQGCDGRTDGSVTKCISLRNFVGEGIKSSSNDNSLNRKPLYEKYILISFYHVYVDNSKIVKYNFGSLN